MDFNIFHDFPTNGKNMILLPFGLYYNVELKNLPLSSDDGRDCLLIDFVNLYLK